MFKFQLWGPFGPNYHIYFQEIHLPMDWSKSEKAYTTVGSWWCSRKVLKMSTAGKAYTTVGSWWLIMLKCGNVQIWTFWVLWAKLPYLFPINTCADEPSPKALLDQIAISISNKYTYVNWYWYDFVCSITFSHTCFCAFTCLRCTQEAVLPHPRQILTEPLIEVGCGPGGPVLALIPNVQRGPVLDMLMLLLLLLLLLLIVCCCCCCCLLLWLLMFVVAVVVVCCCCLLFVVAAAVAVRGKKMSILYI